MINISIDLSKIDRSKIKEGKNGAKYYNLTVDKKREPDQYGNTHTVYNSQSKEERTAKEAKVYLGSGKEFVFNNSNGGGSNSATQAPTFIPSPETIDDLPF